MLTNYIHNLLDRKLVGALRFQDRIAIWVLFRFKGWKKTYEMIKEVHDLDIAKETKEMFEWDIKREPHWEKLKRELSLPETDQ